MQLLVQKKNEYVGNIGIVKLKLEHLQIIIIIINVVVVKKGVFTKAFFYSKVILLKFEDVTEFFEAHEKRPCTYSF